MESQVLLAGLGAKKDGDLDVPQFALVRSLHNEVEEAFQGFEDGEGCDPGFFCACGRLVSATCWCRWTGDHMLQNHRCVILAGAI